jgi:hypothetical protein
MCRDAASTWMTNPSWFLVTGLPWPEDNANAEVAESAFAIAPIVTQPRACSVSR